MEGKNTEEFLSSEGLKYGMGDNSEKYTYLEVKFPSDVKSGNDNLDEVKAIYKPTKNHNSAMILLHGYTMKKEDFLEYGDYLNMAGISSFHLDLPYHGERGINGAGYELEEMSPDEIKIGLEQSISDIKKSVTMLEKVGYKNIGIAGYSLGGISVLLSMGKDKRLKKGIAICAGGDIADLIFNSPITESLSTSLKNQGVSYLGLKEKLFNVEPCNYAKNINPKDLLMINGKKDNIVPPKNTEMFLNSLRNNPKIYWQECDHFSPKFAEYSLNHLKEFISSN